MSRNCFENESLSRYDFILNEFINLAINRFTWDNLPYGLTSEKLELLLITYGQLMFFKDKLNGYYILPCYPTTDLNVYGIANNYRVNGENGKYNADVSLDEGVILKNNPLASGDIGNLEVFAKRIDDVEMTQDVNLFQQCIPKLLLTDEEGRLTAKNIMDKVRKFKFVVFGKKSLINNLSTSDVLDTSAPYILDKLHDYKNDLRNDVLSYLGINNANTDKKERLITDEVNANNDLLENMTDLMFELREQFCKDVKEKFGYEITVKRKEVKEHGEDNSNTRGNSGEQH